MKVVFGYISRGPTDYQFVYQNVTLIGSGEFKVCTNDKLLYNKTVANKTVKLTCECNYTYMRTFKVDGEVILTCKEDPKNLRVEYQETMTCKTDTWTFTDH